MVQFQRHLILVLISISRLLTTSGTHLPKKAEDDDSKLRLVSALFRHGDRTVDKLFGESYPNDPYGNYNFYPDGEGQLTNAGKKRAYELGLLLRNRYNSFLGDVYYQPNVYARSTFIIRCKMTLQLVLAALYPPADVQKWDSELLWQPADFMYVPLHDDDLLLPILSSTYQEVYDNMLESPEVKKKIEKFNNLMKKMSDRTGRRITTLTGLTSLYRTLLVQSNMGLKLPKWTQDVSNSTLLNATVLFFELFSHNELKNLNGGILLNRIIDDMNKVINGTLANRKINLFSAHDVNVAGLLQALDIFQRRIPMYTSSVIIELHEKGGKYFVKVLYYLGIPPDILEMKIPGCEVLCLYDKFIELTSGSTKPFEQPESKQATCDTVNLKKKRSRNIFSI